MWMVITIILFGFYNRLWGSGWFPGNKIVAMLGIVATVSSDLYFAHHSYLHSVIAGAVVGILYLFGRIWAISNYFCCFNPVLKPSQDEGEQWINRICNKHVPQLNTDSDIYAWGRIGMIYRGLYFLPFLGPFFVLYGLIYASMRYLPYSWWVKQRQVPIAEFVTGMLLGAGYAAISALV